MWKPRRAEGSKPFRSPVIVTGPLGENCSKMTVPPVVLSPFRTAIAYGRKIVAWE